uniref:A1i1orf = ymf44 protein n=1 Tax=Prototheca wickerhamii TaxID=3111 RepID=Q35690_PROWI|nr:hypothetical protein [Prototheca wickerhamii]AAD12633.1 orf258, group I orf in cox1 intron 1 [Prototheca wickerhamii]
MVSFRIVDQQVLKNVILPIFDKYPLFTRKYFDYQKFKEALNLNHTPNITSNDRNSMVELYLEKSVAIWNKAPGSFFLSPWLYTHLNSMELMYLKSEMDKFYKTQDIQLLTGLVKLYKLESIVPKYWIIGFIEVKGSFDLVNKSETRIVHGFSITQKEDPLLLSILKSVFHISTQVKFKSFQKSDVYNNFYILDTTNSRAIENIIYYFSGKDRNKTSMKGLKGLEFRIWARSYVKYKGNYEKLYRIRKIIRNLREKLKE